MSPPRWLKHEIPRFLAVGALNTLFGYCLFAALIFVGLHYSLAVLLGMIGGVLFNFKTYGRLVFGSRDNRLLLRFVGVYGILYVVQVSLLKALLSNGLDPYVGNALLVLPLAVLSFVFMKRFVYNNA